jgi:hypothetical protein
MNYVMTFELFTTTYLSAASKLKDKGHFQRAETLQKHVGLGTMNKFDIFLVEDDTVMENSVKVNIHYGDNRSISIFYDGQLYDVSGDKFSDRKNARRFLEELLKNSDFNEILLYRDLPELRNALRVNDFYHES